MEHNSSITVKDRFENLIALSVEQDKGRIIKSKKKTDLYVDEAFFQRVNSSFQEIIKKFHSL